MKGSPPTMVSAVARLNDGSVRQAVAASKAILLRPCRGEGWKKPHTTYISSWRSGKCSATSCDARDAHAPRRRTPPAGMKYVKFVVCTHAHYKNYAAQVTCWERTHGTFVHFFVHWFVHLRSGGFFLLYFLFVLLIWILFGGRPHATCDRKWECFWTWETQSRDFSGRIGRWLKLGFLLLYCFTLSVKNLYRKVLWAEK